MKATDMLNKVKELIGVELSQEVKLAQATLENGTVIESEDFAVGSEVFIVTEDEKVALPVGDYTLEDGETLIVEEEGIIASIGATEEEAPAEEEVEAKEDEKEEMGYATKEELAEVKAMIEEIKSMLEPKEEMSEEAPNTIKSEETTTKTVYASEEEVELSAEPIAKITHNPEAETKKNLNLFSQKRPSNTADRVMQRIANIKK
jgi:cytosine/adenosine deaminase-related metal-dependent hydrolase